jgi:hypothetical protein
MLRGALSFVLSLCIQRKNKRNKQIVKLADYLRDPHWGNLQLKPPRSACGIPGLFCFHLFTGASSVRRITIVIRFGGPFNQNPHGLPAASPVFFVFISSPEQAPLSDENKKSPSLRSVRGFWLRSVADSNRRTRFCRPMPSHSANRP